MYAITEEDEEEESRWMDKDRPPRPTREPLQLRPVPSFLFWLSGMNHGLLATMRHHPGGPVLCLVLFQPLLFDSFQDEYIK